MPRAASQSPAPARDRRSRRSGAKKEGVEATAPVAETPSAEVVEEVAAAEEVAEAPAAEVVEEVAAAEEPAAEESTEEPKEEKGEDA